jgi:hypothetical protein
MAKAKKQESAEKQASAAGGAEPAAKKPAAKGTAKTKAPAKGAANKPAPAGTPLVPLIDTNLAAAAAASMVLNRAGTTGAAGAAGGGSSTDAGEAGAEGASDRRETSTFKQLKQGLSKPGSQGLGGILGGVQGGKKSTQTFAGPNQVRRNQTFGADASRTNVPRRTGG